MKIAAQLTDLVGNTPLLRLSRYAAATALPVAPIAKLEYFNPAGSAKDRIALSMVEEAEKSGLLQPGATIIEPTSGNTGVGLAFVCAVKGYRLILTMPESMSIERRRLLQAYGVQLVLTPGATGMQGAVARAEELKSEIAGAVILQQFGNPANPLAHYRTTAAEIWRDTDGKVDIFVAGVGTGGTVSGTGRRLKELNPAIRVVAVQPASSPLLTGGKAGPHGLQGMGANFVPATYDASVVDRVMDAREEDAFAASRLLAHTEGALVGISSGAALWAASQLAREEENQNKNIVVLLPDTGERYLSTSLFSE